MDRKPKLRNRVQPSGREIYPLNTPSTAIIQAIGLHFIYLHGSILLQARGPKGRGEAWEEGGG